ncbi:hypothetical protein Fleli_2992 [Bernardetia litoralis DSM 6794]|uniref:Uncharacterized protein n=1 Tax=Bernardetia litoralis (strain ATCC 23117 / DSM 6794 / NBRC 15988 / NCIMB 1366 / Fx l1 / Sio-4) TaxID=880071 RepID=I4AMZ9_BERLS|nr:hypothetical protein [Bernardetia litoralis]AFM05334.1 hypothetical protein Fleli_2992 [Bernardetia litoralis DSM 6794]
MKTSFLTLVLLVVGFSSFAFVPSFSAESTSILSEKNIVVSSEKPKTESENKVETKEVKKVTAKELTQKMEANYATNKKDMSLKERIANKLLIKKLKKAEKKEIKGTNMDSGLSTLFRLLGIIFVIVGAVFIISSGVGAGIGVLALGVIFLLIPSII